jgi:hypothetical protein
MTSYNKFNKWVYDYYIDNCIPYQLNSLSIPSSEIEEFAIENEMRLDGFKEINGDDWHYLLTEKEGIPQYFGLIALQCLAAFKMQRNEDISAANFRDHFAELIGVTDVNKINIFCAEIFDNNYRVQEKIWFSAEEFLETKNIILDIPEVGEKAGRYTRFPKSQIILNHEDLKEYKVFFSSINNDFDSIFFEDFKKYYLNNISNFRNKFFRNSNTKNDNEWSEIELKIKLKQIFDFYCSDNWVIKDQNFSFKNIISNENYIIKFSPSELLLYDEYYNILDSLNSLVRNKRFMIFKENKNYPNEFESVNSISLNDNNILLIYQSAANQKEIRESNSVFLPLEYENEKHNVLIFKIENTDNLPEFLKNKVISDYPIELKGFKVSGEKKYFVNNPPKIHLKEDIRYNIYYNTKRIDTHEMNRVGKYTIRINGYSNYNFELVELPILDYPINDKTKSLEFSSLDYKDEELGCINGLLLKYKDNVKMETLTINNWIKTINGSKVKSDNQLLKTIANNRNGKY